MTRITTKIVLRYVFLVLLIIAIAAIAWLSDPLFQVSEAISALILVGLVPVIALGVALMKRKR